MTTITSLSNTRIKAVLKLQSRRYRDRQQLTVVEGVREVRRALLCGVEPESAFICPEILPDPTLQAQVEETGCPLFFISPDVFAKIAYRGSTGGVVLVIPYQKTELANLSLPANPFVVVVEDVEKPGNLGAVLRTADSAGVDALIVAHSPEGAGTDLHNPNAVRASLGTIFSVPIASATTAEVLAFLQTKQINPIVTTPQAEQIYTGVPMRGAVAVVMGSEARGVTAVWLDASFQTVRIPMNGIADSLNLSTATALLLYEVVRQRSAL